MPGRGSVSTVEERRQCIIIVYDFTSVGLAGADGEFFVTRAATELMHACEETIHFVFPLLCGFFLVSVHPSGPRLAASRWVKASYRWSVGLTSDSEERNAVQDER